MMARLAWALSIFFFVGIAHRVLRLYQRRRLQAGTSLSNSGGVTLLVVVSSRCAICPAQKNVVAQLSQSYPSLQVVTIDVERQTEQARKLSVMTVPTTLLQAADGTLVHINNGFVALEPLARQVEGLMRCESRGREGIS